MYVRTAKTMVPVRGRQVSVWCSARRNEEVGSTSVPLEGLSSLFSVLAPSKGRQRVS